MADPKLNLIQKCAVIMAAINNVPKNGHNNFHNYDYATEADINATARKEMAALGVMLIPSVSTLAWREIETKGGNKESIATLTMDYTLTDGVEERHFCVIGEGQDRGDKAVYKAMTGAGKYALLKLFLIPTGDDPEIETEGSQPTGPAKASTPKAPDLESRKGAIVKELQLFGYEMAGVRIWVKETLGHDRATTLADVEKLEGALSLVRATKNADKQADLNY